MGGEVFFGFLTAYMILRYGTLMMLFRGNSNASRILFEVGSLR